MLFVSDRAEFDLLLPDAARALKPGAILWLAYPKLTSSLAGDLNRDLIHQVCLAMGLKTVTQIAIDRDWSALRLKRVAYSIRRPDAARWSGSTSTFARTTAPPSTRIRCVTRSTPFKARPSRRRP